MVKHSILPSGPTSTQSLEEVSRPFEDVLVEVAGLAEQGVKEVTLLGQNVNAYRAKMVGDAQHLHAPVQRSLVNRLHHLGVDDVALFV